MRVPSHFKCSLLTLLQQTANNTTAKQHNNTTANNTTAQQHNSKQHNTTPQLQTAQQHNNTHPPHILLLFNATTAFNQNL